MHIGVGNLTIIGPDNGLSSGRRQAIIWTNAGILLIEPLRTNFNEISIEIHIFSFKKMHLKMSSGKWRPFRLGLNVLIYGIMFKSLKPGPILCLQLSKFSGNDRCYISNIFVMHIHGNELDHHPIKYWLAPVQGWGLLSQLPPFCYFPKFSALSKHTLAIEYHIYIWQVLPQLSYNGTCQI